MPQPAPSAPDATLTRRQMREARQASSHQPHESPPLGFTASSTTSPDDITPTSALDGEARVPRADQTSTEILHPSRRARRAQRASRSRPVRNHRQWASRGALLSALGVLTIVIPVTGLSTTGDTAGAQPAPVHGVAVSALEALGDPSDVPPRALHADPAAASRAAAMELSRLPQEPSSQCADGGTPASGTRAAFADEVSDQVVMPLQQGTYRNTSAYGTRNDPFRPGYSFHPGTDFAAPLGTPIHAVADGVVDYVGYGRDGRSDMLVIVRHEIGDETFWTWNVHMYAPGVFVHEGQEVQAGEVIAEVGNNGFSTGPHLHFEVHTDEDLTTVEPLTWLAEHGALDVSELC